MHNTPTSTNNWYGNHTNMRFRMMVARRTARLTVWHYTITTYLVPISKIGPTPWNWSLTSHLQNLLELSAPSSVAPLLKYMMQFGKCEKTKKDNRFTHLNRVVTNCAKDLSATIAPPLNKPNITSYDVKKKKKKKHVTFPLCQSAPLVPEHPLSSKFLTNVLNYYWQLLQNIRHLMEI